jgi:glycosyltransferase involved in cell wall biosynthesis
VLHALRRRDARLVFVSEPLRAIARDAAPALAAWLDTAVIQPMGIDVARFTALVRAPSDPPTVLVAARLVPIKGVDVAIAAMAYVRSPARLVIAGDGPERTRLLASLRSDMISGEAGECAGRRAARLPSFVGQVTTERRDELLRTAGVVVIPSRVMPGGRTEGTPTIALEALAAGVPVIASSVGGLPDLPGVWLVPPEDPQQLARAIDRLLAHPPPAESLRAAMAKLDWREVASHLVRE